MESVKVSPGFADINSTNGFGLEDKEVFYERNSQIRGFPEGC